MTRVAMQLAMVVFASACTDDFRSFDFGPVNDASQPSFATDEGPGPADEPVTARGGGGASGVVVDGGTGVTVVVTDAGGDDDPDVDGG